MNVDDGTDELVRMSMWNSPAGINNPQQGLNHIEGYLYNYYS